MSSERSLDGKTILVTGGAGFIGSHFIRMVLRRHPSARVVNLDKLTYAGNLDNLHDVQDNPRYEFILGDIRDKALIRRVFARVQGVVHFAAETHVDRSIYDAGEFVLSNALEGKTIPLFGDGLNVRDWLYVEDHCLAVEAAVLRGRHGSVYNVGGGVELTNIEVARRILAALDAARELIQFVPDRPGHDRRYAMDSGLIRALGWEPETPFAEGLKKTVRWYASNMSWWRKVRTRSL